MWTHLQLKWKLMVVFTTITVLPLLVTIIVISNRMSQRLEAMQEQDLQHRVEIVQNLLRKAETEALRYIALLQENAGLIQATYYARVIGDTSELTQYIQRTFHTLDAGEFFDIDDMEIYDVSKVVLAKQIHVPHTYSQTASLIEKALTGQTIVEYDKGAEGFVLQAAGPLASQQEVIAAVVVSFHLDTLFADRLKELTGAEFGLIGETRMVVSSHPEMKERSWEVVVDPRSNTVHIRKAVMIDEVAYMMAFTPLRDPQHRMIGLLAIGLDNTAMQKAIAETRWTLFFITGVIALLTVLVSYGFATLFVRPVRELQQGAEKIRTGDLSQRLPIHSSDEMGELAHSFNQMAETLEEKTLGLEHRNQELARLVEELKATQHQLLQAEKMAAMGQLVSGIAHELNNPLAGVIGSAELLLTQPRNDENTSEGLRRIYREATRAAKIVRNLLTFARQHKPKKQSIQINKVIEETLELRAYELKTHNIQVITALAEVLPKTVADFYQIQQVLLNLINNAEQAMLEAHGRGVLTLKTRLLQQSRSSTPALVSRLALDPGNVDQQNAGASIEISISDDGPGIPPENLQRIFEPFFTTKEVGKGTGLGLSICYSIIQEHGGRIYATSQVGKGATFIIELPVHTGTGVSEDVHGLEISENRVQIRKQILLVDDEETIGEMVEEVLQQCGYSVDQARNGLEAIKKIQHKDYDLIISDLYMPAMGGQELYRWIKEHHTPLTQRMLFITGDLISQRNQAFLAETGNRYLGKPFSMKEFTRIVQEVLGEG